MRPRPGQCKKYGHRSRDVLLVRTVRRAAYIPSSAYDISNIENTYKVDLTSMGFTITTLLTARKMSTATIVALSFTKQGNRRRISCRLISASAGKTTGMLRCPPCATTVQPGVVLNVNGNGESRDHADDVSFAKPGRSASTCTSPMYAWVLEAGEALGDGDHIKDVTRRAGNEKGAVSIDLHEGSGRGGG
jgi:hypothetical protein